MIKDKDGFVQQLDSNEVFVFGSNMNGYHYGGAAQRALDWGAIMGIGVGRQGKTYAIPTLDTDMSKLPLTTVKYFLDEFFNYVKLFPNTNFLLTRIGQGIAGFSKEEIESIMPDDMPSNVFYI